LFLVPAQRCISPLALGDVARDAHQAHQLTLRVVKQGSGQEGGGAESGTGGDSGAGAEEQAATAGSYAPYQSNRSDSEEEVSTAGAQQSALEFLKAMQGRAPPSPAAPTAGAAATAVAEAGDEAAAAGAQADPAEQAAEATDPQEPDSASEAAQSESSDKTVEIDLTTPGLILIEDLEKLEGTGGPDDTEQPD